MMNLHGKLTIFLFIAFLFPVWAVAQQYADAKVVYVNEPKDIGGDYEDEIDAPALFAEEVAVRNWTIADSLAHIPAFDVYCHWDTRNLFLHKEAREYVVDTLNLMLCRESCDFEYPVRGMLTSNFGPRGGRMHYGVDLDLETGDAVSAAFEGMVRISMYHASYGNVVVLRHANGLETLYAHLSKRNVKSGDYVQAGDIIGLGGNTGRSFGSHLHFEVRYLGEPINPNELIDVQAMQLRDWEFNLTRSHFEYPVVSRSASGSSAYYKVKSGDTLSSIARKHKTTVSKLCKLNKLKPTSTIRAGAKLRVR